MVVRGLREKEGGDISWEVGGKEERGYERGERCCFASKGAMRTVKFAVSLARALC